MEVTCEHIFWSSLLNLHSTAFFSNWPSSMSPLQRLSLPVYLHFFPQLFQPFLCKLPVQPTDNTLQTLWLSPHNTLRPTRCKRLFSHAGNSLLLCRLPIPTIPSHYKSFKGFSHRFTFPSFLVPFVKELLTFSPSTKPRLFRLWSQKSKRDYFCSTKASDV